MESLRPLRGTDRYSAALGVLRDPMALSVWCGVHDSDSACTTVDNTSHLTTPGVVILVEGSQACETALVVGAELAEAYNLMYVHENYAAGLLAVLVRTIYMCIYIACKSYSEV